MIFQKNTIILTFITLNCNFFYSFNAFSGDYFRSNDLIPFDTNIKNSEIIVSDTGRQHTIGFLFHPGETKKYSINFDYKEEKGNKEKENSNPLYNQYNFSFHTFDPFNIKYLDNYFTWSLSIKEKLKKICYEGNSFTLGPTSSVCEKSGKKFYTIADKHSISSSGLSTGIGLVARKQSIGWKNKRTFQYGFSSNLTKYNTLLSSKFMSVSEKERIKKPQESLWLDNNFYLNYRYAKSLSNVWSYGFDINTSYSFRENYKEFYKLPNFNFVLGSKITRKLNDKLYLNFDLIYLLNNDIGMNAVNYNQFNEDYFIKENITIKLSFGVINLVKSNKLPKNKYNFENSINLKTNKDFPNYKVSKKVAQNSVTLFKKNNKKKYTNNLNDIYLSFDAKHDQGNIKDIDSLKRNLSLKQYALLFSRKHDFNSKQINHYFE